jgi:hypothetical protein
MSYAEALKKTSLSLGKQPIRPPNHPTKFYSAALQLEGLPVPSDGDLDRALVEAGFGPTNVALSAGPVVVECADEATLAKLLAIRFPIGGHTYVFN